MNPATLMNPMLNITMNDTLPHPAPFAKYRAKPAALSVSLSFVLAVGVLAPVSAHAGFLQDFYDDAGGQSSYTSAGLYASASMDTITGGRYVLKAKREDFQPFYLQAPHLKAGCGGIDFFLGAFSIPSKDEFLNFVRSIGTALPGLAFHVALQSLAPDLNEQISQFRDMLMRLSAMMGDSCQVAENIMQAGPNQWISSLGHSARNALRSSGEAEDASDADALTRTDGGKVLASAPTRTDTNGNVVDAPELNLTWALLISGKGSSRLTQERREVMMSLIGTRVFVKTGSGSDTTVEERNYAPLDLLTSVLGDTAKSTLPVEAVVYQCDEKDKCLNPSETALSDVNLAHQIYLAMQHYRDSLANRNIKLVSDDEITMLATISSLPLLKLSELAASPRIIEFSDGMLETFAQVAAYEAILTAVGQLTEDVNAAVSSSSAKSTKTQVTEYALELQARCQTLRNELLNREKLMAEKVSRVSELLSYISHLQRTIYGDSAIEALSALPGSGLNP